jgi:Ni,Fe-hydrogenase I large subunit
MIYNTLSKHFGKLDLELRKNNKIIDMPNYDEEVLARNAILDDNIIVYKKSVMLLKTLDDIAISNIAEQLAHKWYRKKKKDLEGSTTTLNAPDFPRFYIETKNDEDFYVTIYDRYMPN